MKESLCFFETYEMDDGIGACRLPKERDFIGIAPEGFNVGLDPSKCRDLIIYRKINGIDGGMMKKPESPQAEIDVNGDDVARFCQGRRVVAGEVAAAKAIGAPVDPHGDRLFAGDRRRSDIEREAIFVVGNVIGANRGR